MNTTAESRNSNSRVLIVDDDSEFTHRVSELLEDTHHYVVREENDPRRALETARSFHPDLILLDLIMPSRRHGSGGSDYIRLDAAQRADRFRDRAYHARRSARR